jgi:hypothetical protein
VVISPPAAVNPPTNTEVKVTFNPFTQKLSFGLVRYDPKQYVYEVQATAIRRLGKYESTCEPNCWSDYCESPTEDVLEFENGARRQNLRFEQLQQGEATECLLDFSSVLAPDAPESWKSEPAIFYRWVRVRTCGGRWSVPIPAFSTTTRIASKLVVYWTASIVLPKGNWRVNVCGQSGSCGYLTCEAFKIIGAIIQIPILAINPLMDAVECAGKISDCLSCRGNPLEIATDCLSGYIATKECLEPCFRTTEPRNSESVFAEKSLGFRLHTTPSNGKFRVSDIIEGSQAACFHYRKGDKLVAINDIFFGDLDMVSVDEVKQQLKETPRPVRLTFELSSQDRQETSQLSIRCCCLAIAKYMLVKLAPWLGKKEDGHVNSEHPLVASIEKVRQRHSTLPTLSLDGQRGILVKWDNENARRRKEGTLLHTTTLVAAV